MAITDKTRKIVWGRSGNRCAYCCCDMVRAATSVDDPSVVGDECHIVSEKGRGPRSHIQLRPGEYDKCENLILLCKVHHKLVDDQPNKYTVEFLRRLKVKHERWVRDCLDEDSRGPSKGKETVHFLPRIRTGKDLMNLSAGACVFLLDNDELESEEEVDLISAFRQNVQDWGDIWDDLESGDHVRTQFSMSQEIKQLEQMGFLVFAVRQKRRVKVAGGSDLWPTFVMTVVRKTNPGITEVGTLASIIRS